MAKIKTTLINMGLVILGITLFLGTLEILLILGGNVASSIQNRENLGEGEIRILAIGESTTQRSWPPFLQEKLNKASNQSIKVIDLGRAGLTTTDILSDLDDNLEKYEPHMVITMIGINDIWIKDTMTKQGHMGSFRSIRLLWGLIEIALHKMAQMGIPIVYASEDDAITLANEHIANKNYEKAEEVLLEYQDKNGETLKSVHALAIVYEQMVDFSKARIMHEKALEFDPSRPDLYLELAWFYHRSISSDLAEELYLEAIEKFPNEIRFLSFLGLLYESEKKYSQAQKMYLQAAKIHPSKRTFGQLGRFYQSLGKNTTAQKMFDQAAKIKSENSEITKQNYRIIASILRREGITHIAMQYPLRNLDELKKILGNQPDIIYVGNEENFKSALVKNPYSHYFSDSFAGDFGHTKYEGSKLIADSLVDPIIEIIS